MIAIWYCNKIVLWKRIDIVICLENYHQLRDSADKEIRPKLGLTFPCSKWFVAISHILKNLIALLIWIFFQRRFLKNSSTLNCFLGEFFCEIFLKYVYSSKSTYCSNTKRLSSFISLMSKIENLAIFEKLEMTSRRL